MTEDYKRLSQTYRLLLRANLNKNVAGAIATVLSYYPVNTKGKLFFEYELLFLKLDENQKVGFIIKKINAIANREKINKHFFIGKSPLFKDIETREREKAKAGKSIDEETFRAFLAWAKWEAINKERYRKQNEKIINLCKILMEKLKK